MFLTLFGGFRNTSKIGVFSCFLGVLLRVLIIRSCNSGFFREKLKVRARSDFRTLLVDRNRRVGVRLPKRTHGGHIYGYPRDIIKGIPKGSEDFSGK